MPIVTAVLAYAHQRPAALVELDDFTESVFRDALPAHRDAMLRQDAENCALARVIGLHKSSGGVARFVVPHELCDDASTQTLADVVDPWACGRAGATADLGCTESGAGIFE